MTDVVEYISLHWNNRNVDLFQPPITSQLPQTKMIEASAVTPVFEWSEVTVSSRQ